MSKKVIHCNKMFQKHLHQDIWKYYGYIILSNVLFFLPVDIIFFQERGLNVTEVFLINAIFSIGVAVFEVPTGAIADLIGRKKSLILGVMAWIVSYCLFFYGWGFFALTIAYLTWALGSAFTSGADTALIYDILQRNKKADDFKKYQGIAKMLGLFTVGGSSILGGIIAEFNLGYTFLFSIIPCLGCLYILSSISHEEKISQNSEGKEKYTKVIVDSLQLIKTNTWLIWLLVTSIVFATGHVLLRPVLQIYSETSGLAIGFFGIISAYWFFIGAGASALADAFHKKTKKLSYLFLVLLWISGMFLVANILVKWGFLFFGVVAAACTIASIIIEHEILKVTPEKRHATILSFASFFERIILAGVVALFGYYAQKEGVFYSLQITNFIAGILFTLLLFYYFSSKDKPIIHYE